MGRRLQEQDHFNGDRSSEWGSCYDDHHCSSPRSEFLVFLEGYWGILLIVLVSISIIIVGCRYVKKWKKERARKKKLRLIMEGADVLEFKPKQIIKATKNFNIENLIGKGAQGAVYRGCLLGSLQVAVKKSLAIDEDSLKAFNREITFLSRIRHPSIVVLIGCSYSERNSYLVYEFLSGGDLFMLLHGKKEDNTPSTPSIPWSTRFNIALKVAEALSFLRFLNVLHRDVKPRNVLLDSDNNPKLADFGISKFFSSADTKMQNETTSLVKGTPGYICPEYAFGGEYDASCDTFSFGVLLAELLTGLNAIVFGDESREAQYLFAYFANVAPTDLEHILDPKMKTDQEDEKSLNMMKGVASIACKCVATSRKERPTMLSVWNELKQLETSAYDENKDEVMCTSEQLETTSSPNKLENEEDEVSTSESETAPVGLNMV